MLGIYTGLGTSGRFALLEIFVLLAWVITFSSVPFQDGASYRPYWLRSLISFISLVVATVVSLIWMFYLQAEETSTLRVFLSGGTIVIACAAISMGFIALLYFRLWQNESKDPNVIYQQKKR